MHIPLPTAVLLLFLHRRWVAARPRTRLERKQRVRERSERLDPAFTLKRRERRGDRFVRGIEFSYELRFAGQDESAGIDLSAKVLEQPIGHALAGISDAFSFG